MFCAKCGVAATSPAGVTAKFCANCGTLLPLGNAPGQDTEAPGILSRRQMTVLFCDLVGSTELAEQMDPEDLFAALAAYHQLVQRIAVRYNAHVAKIVGDGVDLYFGYPIAGEDDTARAIHAGLNIVQEISAIEVAGKPLQVRVGLATGQVTVGMQGAISIAGATPNLAARIQAEAQPNQVAVAPSTRRIAGAQFGFADLGLFALKGFSDEVRISAVTHAAAHNSRSAWRGHDSSITLVGRRAELAVLEGCWQRAGDQHCTAALLVAEAGFGKSRLATAFEESLSNSAHLTIRLQCSPFHTNSVLHPFVQHLVLASGFTRHDSALLKAEKLESQLAIVGINEPRDLLLIAELVGVKLEGRYPPLALPPPAQLALTKDALVRYFKELAQVQSLSARNDSLSRYFVGLTRAQPLLILAEDLHWADPTSLELIELLLPGGQLTRSFLLMTARPSFDAGFITSADIAVVALDRLSDADARQMALNLCAAVALPDAELDTVIARTDGIPLFIEEMTRMLLDVQGNAAKSGGVMAGTTAALGVPDTLMDLLMQRLDQLGAAKHLAQVAAVLGSQFAPELLQACAGLSAPDFDAQLAQLVHAGLLLPVAGTQALKFKHALVEKTAYDSILLKHRVTLHARAADALTGDFASRVQGESELVARHLARANRALEAGRYLLQAGLQALGRGAPREASGHFRDGLSALASVAASAERADCELGLLSALGPTTMVLTGPGSDAFGEVQKRAHALCMTLPGQPRQFPITYGLCLYHWGRAEFDIASPLAGALVQTAQGFVQGAQLDESHINESMMAAGNISGMIEFHKGNPHQAKDFLASSVSRYDGERDAALYPVYMMDFGVFGRFYLALATFVCGDADAARQHAVDAYELAQRLNQPHSLGFALLANFNIACMRGDAHEAQRYAEQCVEFASQYGFPEFIGMARIVRGWAVACQGQSEAGLQDMDAGIALWQKTGFENWQTWFAVLRIDVLLMRANAGQAPQGFLGNALQEANSQLARMAANGENQFKSLLLGQKAAVLRAIDAADPEVAALFSEAHAVAKGQEAAAWTRWLQARQAAV